MIQTLKNFHHYFQGFTHIVETDNPFFSSALKARYKRTGHAVILKMIGLEYLPPSLRQEISDDISRLQSLDSPWIIPIVYHDIFKHMGETTLMLAYEDIKGTPLNQTLFSFCRHLSNQADINRLFTSLALQMVQAVREVHTLGIIHRGINPYEFAYIPETNQIKLNGFAWNHAWWPDHLTSDKILPYIAPEQTGRMNQGVDFRANLYSLGVIFFEMVTGTPLFKRNDSLDTIYSHMARRPTEPFRINPSVHPMISDLIMKLLAKHPNDRYQSISGLYHDLETIDAQLGAHAVITDFPLAGKDVSPVFSIPGTLYGRETEIKCLKRSYDKVCSGDNALVIISGETGVGKTELVRNLISYVRSSGGLFFSGKFEKSQRNIHNFGQKTLISNIVKWLLTLDQYEIAMWKEKILAAISPNAQILIDLIPDMELIIGKQSPLCPLPPLEAHTRYKLVMDKFGSLFLRREHPVVYFLDDLQWANKKSIELAMSFIMAKNRKYCLGICTYRHDANDRNDQYEEFFEKLKHAPFPVEHIDLSRLDESQAGLMIAGILGKEVSHIRSMAQIVYEKTKGNPLFISHFMNSLFSMKLIEYDMQSGSWTYDMNRIALSRFTDDMETLLSDKLSLLPEETLELLQVASCMGNMLNTTLLKDVMGMPEPMIWEHVQKSMGNGLLRILPDKDFRMVTLNSKGSAHNDISRSSTIEFAHDQILQSIYQTLPREKARYLHWKIARAMVRIHPPDKAFEDIFDIVNQFSRGMHEHISASEKIELAGYYLLAGQKAMEAVSMETALAYLRSAKGFLPKDSWRNQYDLTFAIFINFSKSLFILGKTRESDCAFDTLLDNAPATLDKIKVYNSMVELNTAVGNISKAIELGRKGLKLIHIDLPESPGLFRLVFLLARVHVRFVFWRRQNFDSTTIADDEFLNESLRLVANIGFPAFFMNPRLCLWIVTVGVSLGLKSKKEHFPLRFAPLGFITLGAAIGAIYGLTRLGKAYTQKGLEFLKITPSSPYQAITYFVSAFFNRHWFEPARKNLDHLGLAYTHALRYGDITYTSFSINMTSLTRIFLGDNLEDVSNYHMKHEDFIRKTRSPFIMLFYSITVQFLTSLTGKDADLDYSPHNFSTLFQDDKNNDVPRFTFKLLKLKQSVFFHDWKKAMDITQTFNKIRNFPIGTLLETEYYFYSCLAATGLFHNGASKNQSRQCRKQIALCLKKMKRFASLCPENFEHLYLLMQAEHARVNHHYQKALVRYRMAIDLAKAKKCNHIVAMACERAGRLYLLNLHDPLAGRAYIIESKHYFELWGANSIVIDLDKRYPGFFSSNHTSPHMLPFSHVDYTSMLDAMQAISQNIVVHKLLKHLMRIVLENTGANRAIFISNKNDELFLEVESHGGDSVETKIKTEQLQHSNDALMSSVVYFVQRTKEPVVMDDASNEPEFFGHVWDDSPSSKSVLCLPMLRKGQLVGILYMENTMVQGVFTKERIEFLKMVASQAAISFENATLYEHVAKNEQDLTILSEKLRQLYSELVMTEERERRHIASDLHDRIGHALAAAKMGLDTIRFNPEKDHTEKLNEIHAIIHQSILDTRTLIFELSPPILYHLGLGPAIDWLCEETERKYPLTVSFDDLTEKYEPNLLSDQKINFLCFKSLREILFNVVKHAQAQTIHVSLDVDDQTLVLTVTDDGKGFDQSNLIEKGKQGGSFGLFSIIERLNLIGGRMDISSNRHQGTTVRILIPIASGEKK